MAKISFTTPLSNLPYVGPAYVSKLKRLGLLTVKDLLYHLPTRYENFQLVSMISLLQPGETVSVTGKVVDIKNVFTKNGKRLTQATISDTSGTIEVIWFNQIFLTKVIKPNSDWIFSGRVDFFGRKLAIISPQYELFKTHQGDQDYLSQIHTGRLVPIYPETEGLTSKWLRAKIAYLLKYYSDIIEDFLPPQILRENNLPSLKETMLKIHFPQALEEADYARRRIAFEELFLLQLSGLAQKKIRLSQRVGSILKLNPFKENLDKYEKSLPFVLTDSQKKASEEILRDLVKNTPMNRLLEGDVGSGKTVVASLALYLAILNNTQAALMAPTEILAQQHYETLSKFLKPLGINLFLLTSSNKDFPENFDFNQPFIAVGTHSLLYNHLDFKNLSLVIIDEQHRFGVEQRLTLTKKGENPHVLTMTATPIPRTMALTFYGDLDLSVLSELPQGRQKIKTWVVPEEKRDNAYEWIKKNLVSVFIVCPLIEESETLSTVKAASKEFENLQKVFPEFKLALLHGRMKAKEKNLLINDFREGKINILVSTPVVEVGIDIPQANIMVIEAAERFGLAQLHQLRGRVGRNNQQAYCLLFLSQEQEQTVKRLKFLESVFSGPKLADIDLKMRGPGDLWGKRQHGFLNLKAADLTDEELIKETKKVAEKIVDADLENKYPELIKEMKKLTQPEYNPN
ncbi:ATP-dependent DNA helicase RecG [Candidatus Microgenomates bacterium]|nr:ATP-dependent DNA helicase RecG [Candidatus Microgenomates bacterium]